MNIPYYILRAFQKLKFNAIRDCNIDTTAYKGHGNQIVNTRIGRYSYLGNNCSIICAEIGSFCSIASGTIIGGGSHPMDYTSTSPAFCNGRNVLKKTFASEEFNPYKNTIIENDVWIGAQCLIKGGVHISTGVVIGMGSVVTKDVPPYAIVAGNPARIIRYRFDENTIISLLNSRWWEWSEEQLQLYGPFFSNPSNLLEKYKCE